MTAEERLAKLESLVVRLAQMVIDQDGRIAALDAELETVRMDVRLANFGVLNEDD